MLVISRKQNESFKIGDEITVTIVRIKGKDIRIGVDAPKSLNVVRTELLAGQNENCVGVGTVAQNGEAGRSKGLNLAARTNGATDGPAGTDAAVRRLLSKLERNNRDHAYKIFQTMGGLLHRLGKPDQKLIRECLEAAVTAGAAEGQEHARRLDRAMA